MRIDTVYYGFGVCLAVENSGKVHYRYTASDVRFDFSLLSEVGEPWQKPFKTLIKKLELKIEIYDGEDGYYEKTNVDSRLAD